MYSGKWCITSHHWKTGVNSVAFVNRFQTSRVECWTANFCDLASEVPDIIMHQLKSNYNSLFKDSYSQPIHTCFAMIASNGASECYTGKVQIKDF